LPKEKPYQCIAFDAVGTLIYPTPAPGEVYYQTARRFGSRLAADEIARRFKQAFRDSEKRDAAAAGGAGLVTSEKREAERWRGIVASVIDDVPDPAGCFAELFAHFKRPEAWSCFEDVPVGMARLREAGFRLAIASNFDSRLHSVCAGHSALQQIDLRVVSSEVGHRKPGRAFFEALVAAAGCPAVQVLMVGDDRVSDVCGAREAGLSAIRLNRSGPAADEIGSLLELCNWLDHH